jgi:hypothetical protein
MDLRFEERALESVMREMGKLHVGPARGGEGAENGASSPSWPAEVQAQLLAVPVSPEECANVVRYEKTEKRKGESFSRKHSLIGIPAEKGSVYEFAEYNLRSKSATKIPQGFKKVKPPSARWLRDSKCGSKKVLLPTNDAPRVPTHSGAQMYRTHDNGGRPFLVYVQKASVFVYAIPHDEYYIPDAMYDQPDHSEDEASEAKRLAWLYSKLVYNARCNEVWVGKSEENAVTSFSGGYGKQFDGNTILVREEEGAYVWIGNDGIRRFRTSSPVATFVSDVGNSDVPYPYAMDEEGAVYLLGEGVKLTKPLAPAYKTDPYEFYYSAHDMLTGDMLDGFWIGDEEYSLTWTPRPHEEFRRLSNLSNKRWGRARTRSAASREKLFVSKDGIRSELSESSYIDLMRRYADERGFEPIDMETVVARDE